VLGGELGARAVEALPSVDNTLARESCCHRKHQGERLFTTNAWTVKTSSEEMKS
jgi:hypothetical protein